MKFLATVRVTYDADDEADAHAAGNELVEVLCSHFLEEDDTADVTQILPLDVPHQVSPDEIVAQLRRSVDLLIATRVVQCIDLARELDKTAWILLHRAEETFDISGYPYGDFQDRVNSILERKPRAQHQRPCSQQHDSSASLRPIQAG